MTMEKVWSETDSVHVGLWKQLLTAGCTNAAVGLLHDVMALVDRTANWDHEDRAPRAIDSRPASVIEAHVYAMEDAMFMMNDKDGERLSALSLLGIFRQDRDSVRVLRARVGRQCHQRGHLRAVREHAAGSGTAFRG